jgi:LmbE family N-acetylglucosaminyl deacetylase
VKLRYMTNIIIAASFSLIGCATIDLPTGCQPMTTSLMSSGHQQVLLVAAHQDDDVFIVSRLRSHAAKQDDIYVIWTATSTPFGDSYAKERIVEAEKAMSLLGVSKDRYYFLKFPDGQTYKDISAITTEVKTLLKKIQPTIMYIPAFEIGHIDHDVAHFSAVRALNELGYQAQVFEFPLYNAYQTDRLLPFKMRKLTPIPATQCRILTKEEYEYVSTYWDVYQSQHFPLGWFISLTVGKRRTFGIEYLREAPNYDYQKKPFDAQPAYERFLDHVTFQHFTDAVKANQVSEH